MGTRNVTVVVADKKVRVAQYCQWDGYLSGQGEIIVDFIQNKMDVKKFKKAVKECVFIDGKAIKEKYVEAGDEKDNTSGMIGMDISDKFKELYPALHRDFGGMVLEMIQDGTYTTHDYKSDKTIEHKIDPVRELSNQIDFVQDGLFCEYAYVVDLDKGQLEVYSGEGGVEGGFIKCLPCLAIVPFSECNSDLIKNLETQEQELAG